MEDDDLLIAASPSPSAGHREDVSVATSISTSSSVEEHAVVASSATDSENFTLELLAKFKNKLHAIKEKSLTEDGEQKQEDNEEKMEDDEDLNGDDWLGHTLHFENQGSVLAKDASTKGDDWFDLYDPRNPINKRKRENKDKKSERDK